MIFLVSCNTFQTRLVCKQIKAHQIKILPLCDISFQFNRCRCRCFDYNKWEASTLRSCSGLVDEGEETKKINGIQVVDKPLMYCEGVAGFFLEDAAQEIKPNIKALDQIKNNLCQ